MALEGTIMNLLSFFREYAPSNGYFLVEMLKTNVGLQLGRKTRFASCPMPVFLALKSSTFLYYHSGLCVKIALMDKSVYFWRAWGVDIHSIINGKQFSTKSHNTIDQNSFSIPAEVIDFHQLHKPCYFLQLFWVLFCI